MFFKNRSTSKYAAFVSYRHKPEDRRWAEWVIDALQRFETPPELARKGVAARIGEVFRDDKEMSTQADLSGYLKQALWESDHLIVICSADTPASDWVRAEIALFQYWGRGDRIHALLIDPEPQRAFPAELRRWKLAGKGAKTVMEMTEPAAASVVAVKGKSENELKALALDKLAAAVLGCDLGKLREAIAKREAAETTYRYFEQMVSRRGVPEGVGEVSEAHVERRNATLRFESRGGRVQRISRLNGAGHLRDNNDGAAQWDISYRSEGGVETIELRNAQGRLKSRQSFNRDATILDFTTEQETAAAQGMGASATSFGMEGDQFGGKSEIVRHLITYDDAGFIASLRYARDQFNTPASDPGGNFGEAFARDARGLALRTWFLGPDDQRQAQRNGVAEIHSEYDAAARSLAMAYFGIDGAPALHKDGFARFTSVYDARGNQIEWAYFGIDGAPTLHKNGYARRTIAYDARGNLTEQALFGIDGAPTLHKDGFARFTSAYDARGNQTEQAYFGVDGAPALNKDGFARFTSAYDARGNRIEWAYFGVDGAPTLHKDGFARVTIAYDARGNKIEWAYFGLDGAPTLHKDGYARLTIAYDARGNVVEAAYFGVDGEPVRHTRGDHRRMVEVDAMSRPLRHRYFGTAGEPLARSNKLINNDHIEDLFQAWRGVVLSGLLTQEEQAAIGEGGFHEAHYNYDLRGHIAQRRFLDVNSAEVIGPNGFSVEALDHDALGRPIRLRPRRPGDGPEAFSVALAYDGFGNAVEVSYRTVDGRLADAANGYARAVLTYDAFQELAGVTYFTADGAEVLPAENAA